MYPNALIKFYYIRTGTTRGHLINWTDVYVSYLMFIPNITYDYTDISLHKNKQKITTQLYKTTAITVKTKFLIRSNAQSICDKDSESLV